MQTLIYGIKTSLRGTSFRPKWYIMETCKEQEAKRMQKMLEEIQYLLLDSRESLDRISRDTGIRKQELQTYANRNFNIEDMTIGTAMKLHNYYLKFGDIIMNERVQEMIKDTYKVKEWVIEGDRYQTLSSKELTAKLSELIRIEYYANVGEFYERNFREKTYNYHEVVKDEKLFEEFVEKEISMEGSGDLTYENKDKSFVYFDTYIQEYDFIVLTEEIKTNKDLIEIVNEAIYNEEPIMDPKDPVRDYPRYEILYAVEEETEDEEPLDILLPNIDPEDVIDFT